MKKNRQIDSGKGASDVLKLAGRVIDLEIEGLKNLRAALDENFEKAIELIFNSAGRVIVTGLGKSGAIGRKISATFASTGTASYFLHASEGLHGDLGIVHKDDVIICLSKSGNTDELSHLMPVFKKMGTPIIAITANEKSVLAKSSDIVLNINTREEACPHGLAPTTSTTAMAALGDAMAVALLEKHKFTREDFAFLHPAGSLGKRLLLKVSDLMEKGDLVPRVSPIALMDKAVLEMAAKRGICMVVDGQSTILGVITTGDLNRLAGKTEHFFSVPVTEVMNQTPKVVSEGMLAYTVYKKMEEFRVIAMPVVDGQEKLVGVIHLHDIMQAGIF